MKKWNLKYRIIIEMRIINYDYIILYMHVTILVSDHLIYNNYYSLNFIQIRENDYLTFSLYMVSKGKL